VSGGGLDYVQQNVKGIGQWKGATGDLKEESDWCSFLKGVSSPNVREDVTEEY